MIIANLATYPARRGGLEPIVRTLAGQVDRMNVVLNEYNEELPELKAFDNVVQILPGHDTKETGKYFPDVSSAKYVLLVDDDIVYPGDFVEKTIRRFEQLDRDGVVGGYHGSLYREPTLGLLWQRRYPPGARKRLWDWLCRKKYNKYKNAYRKIYDFSDAQEVPIIVDQLASNNMILRAQDMPPYSYVRTSQNFSDVRMARWCFERNLLPVLLPREKMWLKPVSYKETMYDQFTVTDPQYVMDEISSYAFKVPGRGKNFGTLGQP